MVNEMHILVDCILQTFVSNSGYSLESPDELWSFTSAQALHPEILHCFVWEGLK